MLVIRLKSKNTEHIISSSLYIAVSWEWLQMSQNSGFWYLDNSVERPVWHCVLPIKSKYSVQVSKLSVL